MFDRILLPSLVIAFLAAPLGAHAAPGGATAPPSRVEAPAPTPEPSPATVETPPSPLVVDPVTGGAIPADAVLIDPQTGAVIPLVAAPALEAAEPMVEEPARERRHGGWGGIDTSVTSINGQPTQLFGFSGGFMANRRFTVGFAGQGIASWVEADDGLFNKGTGYEGDPHFIDGGWGGLLLQWEPWSQAFIHPNLSATFGVGAVTYSERVNEDGWDDAWDVHADVETDEGRPVGLFGVTELAAGGTLNVARWCRLDVEASYRIVSGVDDLDGLEDGELGGPAFGLGLRFGGF